jgi:hypothetical protein
MAVLAECLTPGTVPPDTAKPLRGLLFGFAASVTSDAVEKVPTGGELTLFEAVDPEGLTFSCCVARRRSGCSA